MMKRIDHIALTVPDVEEATRFFEQAFGAEILYDGHRPSDPAVEGPIAEAVFGMPEGSSWIHRRLIQVGDSVPVELFQYQVQEQKEAARTFDIGLQHLAFQVDDLRATARQFQEAGGELYPTYNPQTASLGQVSSQNGWVYGKTPWGTIIELVTFPS